MCGLSSLEGLLGSIWVKGGKSILSLIADFLSPVPALPQVIYSRVVRLAEAQSLTRKKQVQISLVQQGVPKLGTSHVRYNTEPGSEASNRLSKHQHNRCELEPFNFMVRLAGAQRMTRVQPVSGSRRKAGRSLATDQGAAGSEQSGCTGPVQDMLSAGPQHISQSLVRDGGTHGQAGRCPVADQDAASFRCCAGTKADRCQAAHHGAAGSEQSGCTGPVQDMQAAGPQQTRAALGAKRKHCRGCCQHYPA